MVLLLIPPFFRVFPSRLFPSSSVSNPPLPPVRLHKPLLYNALFPPSLLEPSVYHADNNEGANRTGPDSWEVRHSPQPTNRCCLWGKSTLAAPSLASSNQPITTLLPRICMRSRMLTGLCWFTAFVQPVLLFDLFSWWDWLCSYPILRGR